MLSSELLESKSTELNISSAVPSQFSEVVTTVSERGTHALP
jgi:hypothetical protein